jgi:hypothetical protein
MSVEELKKAIALPSPEELTRFQAWFEEICAEMWDQQIERDVKAGKFDKLVDEALADFDAGRCREL